MGALDDFRSWSRRQGAPITVGLVLALVLAAIAFSAARSTDIETFVFDSDWLHHPWSIVTYPFLASPFAGTGSLIGFIFFTLWLFWIGSSLEREAGAQTYSALLATMTVAPALFLWIGTLLMQSHGMAIGGAMLPEAGLTVAWGTRNPRAVVMLWGILPIQGLWIAILSALGILITFGNGSIPFGIFAAAHLVIAWAWGTGRLNFNFGAGGIGPIGKPFRRNIKEVHATRAQARYDESYYDEVRKREKEREERERLKRLLGDLDE
jgi:hypothetical protein